METISFRPSFESTPPSEDDDSESSSSKSRKNLPRNILDNSEEKRAADQSAENSERLTELDRRRLIELPSAVWRHVVGEPPDTKQPVVSEIGSYEPEKHADETAEDGEEGPALESLESEELQLIVEQRLEEIMPPNTAPTELDPETIAAAKFLDATAQELGAQEESQVTPDVALAARRAYERIMSVYTETADGAAPGLGSQLYTADGTPPPEIPVTHDGGRGGNNMPPRSPFDRFHFDNGENSQATIPYPAGNTHFGEQAPPITANGSEFDERRAVARGLLIGGIIGYLIGRRRGRIKTEKKLGVIQKKLEGEVQAARKQIFEKEMQVRQLVRERAEVQDRRSTQEIVRAEVRQAAPKTQESVKVNPQENRTERLGKVTLKALEGQTTERVKARAPTTETMTRKELLETSESIAVGGTTLRRVYETNLISEHGLRRAVGEFRRGGDVRKVLAEELLMKEMSYERDPLMRNQKPKSISQNSPTGTAADTAQAQADGTQIAKTAAEPQASPTTSPPSPLTKQRTPHPALVAADIIAFTILAILVIVWLITKV